MRQSLDGFGFVNRQGDRYKLTQESAQYLTQSGGLIQDFLRLGGDISRQVVLLEEDIRTGEVPNFHFDSQSLTCSLNYYTMLKSIGKQGAPNVLKFAKLNRHPNDCWMWLVGLLNTALLSASSIQI